MGPTNNKSNLMGLRQFARYRNISLRAVQKAIESGRLTPIIVGGRRLIDPERAVLELDAKTRISVDSKSSQDPPDPDSYHQSRAQKEYYQAQLARLEYEKRMGELLEAEEVKQAIIKNVSITRETLLNIPDRIAPVLLSQNDLHTVTEILRTEIHNALVSLSDLEAG